MPGSLRSPSLFPRAQYPSSIWFQVSVCQNASMGVLLRDIMPPSSGSSLMLSARSAHFSNHTAVLCISSSNVSQRRCTSSLGQRRRSAPKSDYKPSSLVVRPIGEMSLRSATASIIAPRSSRNLLSLAKDTAFPTIFWPPPKNHLSM